MHSLLLLSLFKASTPPFISTPPRSQGRSIPPLIIINCSKPPAVMGSLGQYFSRPQITHVIFDMDGLLLDTEKYCTEASRIILERYGKRFDWSVKVKMLGKKAIEAATVCVEETGLANMLTPEDYLAERETMLREMFRYTEAMPGALRLVKHFYKSGVPVCVASGSHKSHFELKTRNHADMFSRMHHVVLADDPEVKQGKPAPDIFLVASKRFENGPIDPSKILVFEDAPAGVRAAKSAGMSVVMVPDPRLDTSYGESADQVISTLLDFQPSEWGLPEFAHEEYYCY